MEIALIPSMGFAKLVGQRAGTVRDLFRFLWERKLWWMIPLVVVLLVLCGLILLATQSPVAPFVYTLF